MYERFEELLKEKGCRVSDVSKSTGILSATFTSWKSGKYTPKQEKMQQIADYFGVSVAWLMGISDNRDGSPSTVKIPVFSSVSAGNAKWNASEYIVGYEDIPSAVAQNTEYFGLKISGDSMSPSIQNGDTVIVRKTNTADSGNIVIALVGGEDGICKKLIRRQDGIILKSLNEEYGNFEYSNDDIQTLPVIIVGVVEQMRRNF